MSPDAEPRKLEDLSRARRFVWQEGQATVAPDEHGEPLADLNELFGEGSVE